MPISRRTVIFHLSNARRKLGAANSRHAITRAISLGLIDARSEARRAPGGAEQV
jgi:DNA-binding NarL/FixJ family response regulator